MSNELPEMSEPLTHIRTPYVPDATALRSSVTIRVRGLEFEFCYVFQPLTVNR